MIQMLKENFLHLYAIENKINWIKNNTKIYVENSNIQNPSNDNNCNIRYNSVFIHF